MALEQQQAAALLIPAVVVRALQLHRAVCGHPLMEGAHARLPAQRLYRHVVQQHAYNHRLRRTANAVLAGPLHDLGRALHPDLRPPRWWPQQPRLPAMCCAWWRFRVHISRGSSCASRACHSLGRCFAGVHGCQPATAGDVLAAKDRAGVTPPCWQRRAKPTGPHADAQASFPRGGCLTRSTSTASCHICCLNATSVSAV